MNKSDVRPLWTIPSQVRKARELVGLSLSNAAVRIGVPVQLLSAWEEGKGEPSMAQLRQLSEVYKRAMRFFFVLEEVVPFTEYRRLPQDQRAELSYETRRAWAEFENWCRLSWELELLLELPAEVRLRQVQLIDKSEIVAAQERNWLREVGLQVEAPPPSKMGYRQVFQEYRMSIESIGVKVFAVEMPVAEIRGAAWWHKEYGPAILVNQNDGVAPKLVTLLHEYAHLLLREVGSGAVCDWEGEDDAEQFARRFSAALLVPEESLLSTLKRRDLLAERDWDDKVLESLARTFKVSKHVIAISLENLRLAKRGFYRERRDVWQRELSEKGAFWGKGKRRPDWQIHIEDSLGLRYEKLVQQAFNKGLLTKADLMRYLGRPLSDVDRWLEWRSESG